MDEVTKYVSALRALSAIADKSTVAESRRAVARLDEATRALGALGATEEHFALLGADPLAACRKLRLFGALHRTQNDWRRSVVVAFDLED